MPITTTITSKPGDVDLRDLQNKMKPPSCPKCGGEVGVDTSEHVICKNCGHDLGTVEEMTRAALDAAIRK